MRYYTVEIGGTEKVAASADGKKLFVLPQFVDMNDLIAKGGVAQISEDAQAAGGDVKILSPIPRPRQDVLCLGINYAAHAVEADRFSSEAFGGERPYPIFFAKIPLLVPGLQIPRTDIIDNRITENIVRRILPAHVKSVFADDHAQLALIVQ